MSIAVQESSFCSNYIRGPPFNYQGGGVEFLNVTNYLLLILTAILYLVHTLPQAKYLFHSLIFFFLSTKLDQKLCLVLMWELRRRTKRDLITPSEAIEYLRAIKYLFTACPSDNYLFHEKSARNKSGIIVISTDQTATRSFNG